MFEKILQFVYAADGLPDIVIRIMKYLEVWTTEGLGWEVLGCVLLY